MHLDYEDEGQGARLEMTPLMDVIFLLLVFFIYAMVTMSVHRGVDVSLPQVESANLLVGDSIEINLTVTGQAWIEGIETTDEQIVSWVVEKGAGRSILICADEQVPLGRGLKLLSALRAAGVEAVAFQTRMSGTEGSSERTDGEDAAGR